MDGGRVVDSSRVEVLGFSRHLLEIFVGLGDMVTDSEYESRR